MPKIAPRDTFKSIMIRIEDHLLRWFLLIIAAAMNTAVDARWYVRHGAGRDSVDRLSSLPAIEARSGQLRHGKQMRVALGAIVGVRAYFISTWTI